jgi:CDGSH-type Zn-finger protein
LSASHQGTGLTPLMYEADKTGQVWFCGCKATGKSPLCDGTHNRL